MNISQKAQSIPPFLVMEVLERAKELEAQGVDMVHLEVGEPDFDTPKCVVEHAVHSLREGNTHYTHSMGRIHLRIRNRKILQTGIRLRDFAGSNHCNWGQLPRLAYDLYGFV